MKLDNSDSNSDIYLQALREDLPSEQDDRRIRSRLIRAGGATGLALAVAPAKAATGQAIGAGAQLGAGGETLSAATGTIGTTPTGTLLAAGAGNPAPTLLATLITGGGALKVAIAAGVLVSGATLAWKTTTSSPLQPNKIDEQPHSERTVEMLPTPDSTPSTTDRSVRSHPDLSKRRDAHQQTISHKYLPQKKPNFSSAAQTSDSNKDEENVRRAANSEQIAESHSLPLAAELGEEAVLLQRALAGIQNGNYHQARRALLQHEKRFPHGSLTRERVRTNEKLNQALLRKK